MITEEQRLERLQGLGGSDIAAILGLSPWATPVTIWLDKKGKNGPQLENEAMWWGSNEEALVAKRFSELTGKKTVNYNKTIHDGTLLANIDRLIIPNGAKIAAFRQEIRTNEIFEAKTAGCEWPEAPVIEVLPNGFEVLDGDCGVPAHYQCQCNHYLGRVPSATKIYVAVKMSIPCKGFSRTKFGVYVINRDDAIINAQDAFARAWWEKYIVGDKIPEAQNEEEAKRIWKRSKPKTSVTIDLPTLDAYIHLGETEKVLKEVADEISKTKSILQNAMKDNESLVSSDSKVVFATWKQKADRVEKITDWESIARAKGATPSEIEAATKEVVKSGSRTFLPKFNEEAVKYALKLSEMKHKELAMSSAKPFLINPEIKVA